MSKGNRKCLALLYLSLLILTSSYISLLHTDSAAEEDPYCPGCVFQSTSVTTTAVHSFELPDLTLLGFFRSVESNRYTPPVLVFGHARSPPAV
jgi:hypothetical protein